VPDQTAHDPTTDPRLALGDEAGTGEVRPWGAFLVLDDGPLGKVKRITVDPGKRLSYQVHHRRKEHWFVVAGTAHVTLDDVEREVGPGEAIDIPLGTAHRVANQGTEPLVFVEVQQGDYFGEDDIVRLDDDFGRAGTS
jgi:mannose-6-phosphate isomerase